MAAEADLVRAVGCAGRAVPLLRLWREDSSEPFLARAQAVGVLCAPDAVPRVGTVLARVLDEATDSDAEWCPGDDETVRTRLSCRLHLCCNGSPNSQPGPPR